MIRLIRPLEKQQLFSDKEFFALYSKGLSDAIVGKELGVSYEAIHKRRCVFGLPANKRQGGNKKSSMRYIRFNRECSRKHRQANPALYKQYARDYDEWVMSHPGEPKKVTQWVFGF